MYYTDILYKYTYTFCTRVCRWDLQSRVSVRYDMKICWREQLRLTHMSFIRIRDINESALCMCIFSYLIHTMHMDIIDICYNRFSIKYYLRKYNSHIVRYICRRAWVLSRTESSINEKFQSYLKKNHNTHARFIIIATAKLYDRETIKGNK